MLYLFLITLCWLVILHGRKTDYSPGEIQILLDLHNNYRKRAVPEAANMMRLEWQDELASMAQDWADLCGFEHGHPKRDELPFNGIGQNLNKFTSTNPARLNSVEARTVQAVQAWWDEERWYNYESSSCTGPICGHYTQLVWARTQYVGCGYLNGSRCPGMFTYVVCNYGPMGNKGLDPKVPYIKGKPCSKCDSGHGWCEDGLCIECPGGNCDCPLQCKNCGVLNHKNCSCACAEGWDYADCSEACENSDSRFCSTLYEPNCGIIRPELCRAQCRHCAPFRNTTNTRKCCAGKICHNKGYLNTEGCHCVCKNGYSGNHCEHGAGNIIGSCWSLLLVLALVSLLYLLNLNC
ncbi:cysteine-rich venom protein-like isoform X1 [Huso huso]|uniref:Cysteine-rich venom protein-like isoform X1 n=1 Tax=Huso huso TaxID=61971 RepID=A0ABR0YXG3_HUSHU